jgi:hypothetical protein
MIETLRQTGERYQHDLIPQSSAAAKVASATMSGTIDEDALNEALEVWRCPR